MGIYRDLKRNCDCDHYESSLHKGSTETVNEGGIRKH